MQTALICTAAVLLAACSGHPATAERLDCTPIPELRGPGDTADPISVERKGGDLVWTDTNGIEHRITERDSWRWTCRPAREV
jgi:hypothetical protein